MGSRMTFHSGEHDLRNDVTFRSRSQSIHHRGRRSLENLPVDMMKCFPSKLMHVIYLGVTKKLISLWKKLAIKRLNRMDQSIIASINDALDLCRQHTTCDFQWKCRSLYEVSVWKATECRLSVHCGFVAAKQAAQWHAEEVYFQSILNRDMAENVTEPEVTDDSSKQIVSYRNSKQSTTRPDNVVISNGRPGTVKRKNTDYLCTSEELEVAEVEAGFALVEFSIALTHLYKIARITLLIDGLTHLDRNFQNSVADATELRNTIQKYSHRIGHIHRCLGQSDNDNNNNNNLHTDQN
ncbi:unnamed protein product [Schistosoma margrebowiei]|uniref:Uncharacterized protein n=1 Tax=Schistosoma margrebowiei TaxID=48269 RepID=A0A183MA97_9TREM|nr:unnamed protein product [Schistosoma margrebowiei]